jgi:hypothetical protein
MSVRIFKGTTSPSVSDTISVNGVGVDLTGATVKFRMRDDDSSTLLIDANAVVVSAVAGTVRYDWLTSDTATAGDFAAWWHVTLPGGATQDTSEFIVQIEDHAVGSSTLASLIDVRREMELVQTDTTRDQLIEEYLVVATDAIQTAYERQFVPQVTTTKTFEAERTTNIMRFAPFDLLSATTVTLDPESTQTVLTAGTDYVLRPLNQPVFTYMQLGAYLVYGWSDYSNRFGGPKISITGTWGWPAVPAAVKQACALTVASWLRRDYGNFDISSMGVAMGGREIAPDAPLNFSIPPAARRLLQPYVRRRHF